VSTEAELGPEHVLDRLVTLGRDIRSHVGGIETLGLGVPGLFDPDIGVVELFPNLAGDWAGYGLRDKVGEGIGLDPTMVNDARAFTLAEGTIGAGRGAKVMLGITLGTGIGGGVMIDGQLHTGAFGHQTVSPDGPTCGCGIRGCLEAVAKGSVLSAEAGTVDVEGLYAAAAKGDGVAIRTLERANFFMAIAISNAVSLLGVDVVVVGGGVASSGDLVLDPLRRAVAERVMLVPTNEIRIVAAELGPMAGAIGAALAGAS
jgi:glucokinase